MIWITGLSGAGKSTTAKLVADHYIGLGKCVVRLDGDELREVFGSTDTGDAHMRSERLSLARSYSRLCRLLASQGVVVIIATISMFEEVYSWNRENIANYFEAYLKVPLQKLEERDPKDIYKRFRSGELSNVAGLDLPVDEPKHPNWELEFNAESNAVKVAESMIKSIERWVKSHNAKAC